ncbi:hypothetical protein QT381_12715 [Galbitalea sp. SE-J8]|uniref:hypothetical protein n=1 Tax=Galbitalea sp. SE-J8 TaxID=3054952 RepID=UPI00259CE976|nr:hypothetical protein [Galbitalea sp. SE-J8]MDM4763871.1 hypothetical protein [Galbitalea sp. SE-J8]
MNPARSAAIVVAAALPLGAVAGAPGTASAAAPGTVSGRISFPPDAVPAVALYDGSDEVAEGDVAPDGSYTITAPAAGEYTVAFSDDGDTYLTRFWNGTAAGVVLDDGPDGATFFSVADDAQVAGIDGTLGLVPLGATAPTIGGTPRVGRTLTLVFGDWADVADLDIVWRRDGVAIAGAEDAEYDVDIADAGHRLSAVIVATADGYEDATVSTASVSVPGKRLRGARPTITGAAKVGARLVAKPGRWTAGTRLRYQWLANGKPIARATKSGLRLTKRLAGARISVVATGYRKGYALLATTSKRTGRVR